VGHGNSSDPVAEKLDGGGFAECARFALEATRAVLRSDGLIGSRYLAISGTKQKAEFLERATIKVASRVLNTPRTASAA